MDNISTTLKEKPEITKEKYTKVFKSLEELKDYFRENPKLFK
jgi:hypothetical protein